MSRHVTETPDSMFWAWPCDTSQPSPPVMNMMHVKGLLLHAGSKNQSSDCF